jgi:hypothetical protein
MYDAGSRKLDWNGLEVLWRLRNLKTLVLKAGLPIRILLFELK